MSDAQTPAAGMSSGAWFRGRPRSWAFFALGSAFAAILQWAPLLLWQRPETPGGWLVWFLVAWALTAAFFLFRDPILDNPFARRLVARSDPGAPSARVMYLLLVFAALVLVWLLVAGAFSLLVALVRPA